MASDGFAQVLMAGAVPLVLGVSVAALAVVSANAGEGMIELRWSWVEQLLERDFAAEAAGELLMASDGF